jgi:hypothetical protein
MAGGEVMTAYISLERAASPVKTLTPVTSRLLRSLKWVSEGLLKSGREA